MALKNIKKKIIVVIASALIVGALSFSTTSRLQEQALSCITYPFLLLERSCIVPLKHWLYWRHGAKELRLLSQQIIHERDDALRKVLELEAERDYFKDCAELIEFKKRYACDTATVAQILLKNFSSHGHFFLVDAGHNKSIKKDMVALYKNNIIGRVNEVYPWYCKVVLITDSDCYVAAKCVKTGSQGIHTGCNKLDKTELSFVSHLDTLEKGDVLISHGDGLIFPRGFALGKVIDYRLVDVRYEVSIEPLIDMQRIDFCVLIDRGSAVYQDHVV